MSKTNYIVVNDEENTEECFETIDKARAALVFLITMGFSAHMFSLPLHRL